MRILYITPRITGEGGLVRVISLKANYLSTVFGHEIHILTQNENAPLFHEFHENVSLHSVVLEGKNLMLLNNYRVALKDKIKLINPELIIVCDGLKGFFVPWMLTLKMPILFEVHGSIYNTENEIKRSFFNNLRQKNELIFKKLAARKFTKIILLSQESAKEWDLKNNVVIPNPIWFTTNEVSALNTKKAIAVARHSYEKGIDRLLLIWQKVVEKHPDWILDIYGEYDLNLKYQKMAVDLSIEKYVNFHQPVVNIIEKYQEATLCLMTSRFEGFGMVLLEAMNCGLPCIAFDCPCGPRSIIKNNENGLLIENDNIIQFSERLIQLINDKDQMIKMGKNAVLSVEKYNLDDIMNQWNELFYELTTNLQSN